MNNGRRVELDVTYNNAPFAGQVGAEIESLTYVDNAADDSDSIDITLDAQDSNGCTAGCRRRARPCARALSGGIGTAPVTPM